MADDKQLSIKQNMLWNSVGSLTNLGCQWLITVLIVRLSTDYYIAGVYSLASSVYGIFSVIGEYRMYTYQISDVSDENTTGEYFAFRLVTLTLSFVATMLYAFITCAMENWAAIALFAFYKGSALCLDVLHATAQRNNRLDITGQSLGLQGIVSLVVFVVIFYLTQNLELTLFAMAVGVVVLGLTFTRPRVAALDSVQIGISRTKTIYLLKHCALIVLASLAASATSYVPRQYLASVMGNEALGIYASVAAPVAIIQMGASYIYSPLLGYFAQQYATKDKNGFMRLFVLTTGAIAAVGLVCGIALEFTGQQILVFVYGESISNYAYLLIPLVFFAFLTGYQWFLNSLLISLRNFKSTFMGSFLPLVTVLLTMVPAIQLFQMNGVTAASMSACLVSIAYMVVSLFKQLKANFDGTESVEISTDKPKQ